MNPAAVLSILVQAKGLAKTSSELEKLNATAKQSAKSTENLDKKFSNLDRSVGDFNRSMSAARNTIQLVKFPALIAGAGMATQAVGALAAGAVSLGSALGPLAGAGAAGAAGMVAMGQAAGVAKLATLGLGDAIKGQKGAMDKLSPVQRHFVKDIRALRQESQALRGDAQRGLLPGLDKALGIVTPLMSKLRPIVRDTARVMGELAVSGAHVVRSWGSDLQTVGKTNVVVIRNLGKAAIAAADGARHLVVAGGPLLVWLSQLATGFAGWIRGQVQAGRESGRLAGFLEKTRDVMSTLGHIALNLGAALFGIGKAAAPLGRDLLKDLEKLTAKFREWVESASGRNTLDDYFRSARRPIQEIAGLIGDVGAAFLRLSTPGPKSGGMIAKLRELVPVLENVISTTTAAFGPVLIDALGNVVRLFGQLAGTSGPLTVFVQLIGVLAGGLADLLSSNPMLNSMVVSLLGFAGVIKALGLVSAVTGMSALGGVITGTAGAYRALAAGASVATVSQERGVVATVAAKVAMVATTVATAAWTAAQWLLNAALTANPIGLVIVGLAALGAALVLAYTKVEFFRNGVNATFAWLKSNWPLVLGILTGPIGLAVLAIVKHWAQIKSTFTGALADLKAAMGSAGGALASAAATMAKALIGGFKSALNLAHELAVSMRDLIAKAPGYALGVGKAIVSGIVDGIKSVASHIGDAIKGAIKSVDPTGLTGGIGDALGKASIVPMKAPGSLMGARPSLAPFAAVGAANGLRVSSGLRKGAITSSGNPSYHSTGEAVDLAGPPAGMLKTFRTLRSRFGSKLAELIHTPGGAGIKDGKPFVYTGKVAADHFDHVHVAFDSGMPGVGDGIGKAGGARKAFTGDGSGKGLHLPLGNFGEVASRVWNKATSLMGSPGAQPRVQFAPRLGGGASYAVFSPSNGRITVSQKMLDAFRDPKSKDHNYALKALVHEYAHARQTAEVHNGPRRLLEGGAEAFAGWASPRIYGALGIPYSYGGGAYESFVNWVVKNKPVKWWQHDQFASSTGAIAKTGALATPSPSGRIGVAVDAARKAGFSGTELVNMIAIAGRESTWDPTVTNFKPPDHSIGLWQINQLAHHGKYGTDQQLKDPYTNAKAARALFKQRHYQPWHGFVGITKAVWDKARAAVTGSRQGAASSKSGGSKGGGMAIGKPTYGGGPKPFGAPEGTVAVPVGGGKFKYVQSTEYEAATQHASDIAAQATEPRPTVEQLSGDALSGVQDEIDFINLQEKAGMISAEAAKAQRTALLQGALTGARGQFTPKDWLQLKIALDENTAATEEQTARLQQMNDLLTQQRDEARRERNASESNYRTLSKAIADVASGQIGGRVGLGFMSPSFPGGGSRY